MEGYRCLFKYNYKLIMDFQSYPVLKHSGFTGIIGVAQEDITPPAGIYSGNWGAAEYDTAEGIHRPLMLTCLTFQSSKEESPLVLIAADLGWWKSLEDEWFLRKGILEALSLKSPELMFCLSHTHSGPGIYRGDAAKPGGQFIEPYLNSVQQAAIRAIKTGLSKAEPATLTWNYGKCNLATNRDLPEKNSERIVVGFNADKAADDTLLVGRITDKEHRIIATVVNYACHPTTLAWENRLISPDFVGAMRETIQLHTQAPSLFLQGASGNLAPSEQYVGDTAVADKHGRQLGFSVLSTLEAMLPPETQLSCSRVMESGAALAIWERSTNEPAHSLSAKIVEVSFPLKSLPRSSEIENEWEACKDRVLKERLSRKLAIRKAIGDGDIAQIPLWIWQLGDSFLIGQPNEAYSDFQEQLRRRLSPRATAVMNIVNGSVGYLPPRELYGKDIYPVWQTPFAAGSLELLIETAIKAAEE
jgi:hypothetical protein